MTDHPPPSEPTPDPLSLPELPVGGFSPVPRPIATPSTFTDDMLPDEFIVEDEPPMLATVPKATRARKKKRWLRYPRRRVRHSFIPLVLVLGTFATMMVVSVLHIAYSVATSFRTARMQELEIRQLLIRETAIVEGIDSVLVLGCLLVAGWPRFRRKYGAPLLAWLFAWPGLAICLAINIGYSLALQQVFQPDPDQEWIDIGLADGAWAILLVCLQPAVIEELFFRGLLLGHLRHHLGTHGAVWLSSILFGFAHLGNPIGWPVLILLGVGLGYTRIASRGLLLPMVLHFLHNLTIIILDDQIFRQ